MNKQNSTAMNWAIDFTKNIKQPSHLSYLPLFLVKRFIKVYITYRLFIPLKKKCVLQHFCVTNREYPIRTDVIMLIRQVSSL